MTIPLEKLLPYASFAIALGGLVARIYFPPDSRKETISAVVIAFLVLMTGVGLYQAVEHERHVEAISTKIVAALGSDTKTFDQIYEALFPVDFPVANEALDYLVNSNIVGHRVLDVRDDLGSRFRVRGYYFSSSNSTKMYGMDPLVVILSVIGLVIGLIIGAYLPVALFYLMDVIRHGHLGMTALRHSMLRLFSSLILFVMIIGAFSIAMAYLNVSLEGPYALGLGWGLITGFLGGVIFFVISASKGRRSVHN